MVASPINKGVKNMGNTTYVKSAVGLCGMSDMNKGKSVVDVYNSFKCIQADYRRDESNMSDFDIVSHASDLSDSVRRLGMGYECCSQEYHDLLILSICYQNLAVKLSGGLDYNNNDSKFTPKISKFFKTTGVQNSFLENLSSN